MLLDNLSEQEALARLTVFIVVFVAIAIFDVLAPRPDQRYSKSVRWFNHFLNS